MKNITNYALSIISLTCIMDVLFACSRYGKNVLVGAEWQEENDRVRKRMRQSCCPAFLSNSNGRQHCRIMYGRRHGHGIHGMPFAFDLNLACPCRMEFEVRQICFAVV